jgi:hypothetical protein
VLSLSNYQTFGPLRLHTMFSCHTQRSANPSRLESWKEVEGSAIPNSVPLSNSACSQTQPAWDSHSTFTPHRHGHFYLAIDNMRINVSCRYYRCFGRKIVYYFECRKSKNIIFLRRRNIKTKYNSKIYSLMVGKGTKWLIEQYLPITSEMSRGSR